MTQTDALAGAFDQAGDIRGHEALLGAHLHHAQHRAQGGEMIVGNLGFGRTDHADQSGFAHIGEADQTHVGDQLQLQAHLVLLSLIHI